MPALSLLGSLLHTLPSAPQCLLPIDLAASSVMWVSELRLRMSCLLCAVCCVLLLLPIRVQLLLHSCINIKRSGISEI